MGASSRTRCDARHHPSAPREATRPAAATVASAAADTNAVREVKALIPNLGAVSAEEGTRILREAALKDFTAAATELEAQVKEAQRRLAQAQERGLGR